MDEAQATATAATQSKKETTKEATCLDPQTAVVDATHATQAYMNEAA